MGRFFVFRDGPEPRLQPYARQHRRRHFGERVQAARSGVAYFTGNPNIAVGATQPGMPRIRAGWVIIVGASAGGATAAYFVLDEDEASPVTP